MKFLIDANLAPALVDRFADLAPNSAHVADIGDIASSNRAIWDLAAQSGFVILTKDTDFLALGELFGAPPKVILLRVGNVPTATIEILIRRSWPDIEHFEAEPIESILILGP